MQVSNHQDWRAEFSEKPRIGSWLLALFAVLFSFFSLSIFPLQSTQAADLRVNVTFDSELQAIDWEKSHLAYSDFASFVAPSGLTVATEEIVLPLWFSGAPPTFEIKAGDREWIGWLDPRELTQQDIPTADDGRYASVRPASADLHENGFALVDQGRLELIASGALLRFLASPYEIDSQGNVYFRQNMQISFSSSAELRVGQPLDKEEIASARTANRAQRTGSSAIVEYVIITNATLAVEFETLAEYRNSLGMKTEVKLIEDILGAYSGLDEAESLRNYLKDYYQSGGVYVFLAGDETVIPIRYTYYYNTSSVPPLENQMICDLYFADLTGDWDSDGDGVWGEPTHDSPDLTAELLVGRLPISSPTQARNYIEKLIVYETDPGFGDRQYLGRTLIFSSDQMRDFSDAGQHAIIAGAMPETFTVDTGNVVETPSGSSDQPSNLNGEASVEELNNGFGIINIIAHGRYDGFAVRTANYNEWPKSYMLGSGGGSGHGSLESGLQANGTIGLYVALSCDLGGFDMDAAPFSGTAPSFVESVMSTKLSGAVGMVAYSRWGWVYSSYNMHREFLSQLFGAAEGKAVVAMNLTSERYPYYRDLIYGQNYAGDPTVTIHNGVPQETALTLLTDSWNDGELSARVTVAGAAQRGITVYLSQAGEILASAVSDADGYVTLDAGFQLGEEYSVACSPSGALVARQSFTPGLSAGIDDDNIALLPTEFSLQQNYPNPFNPTTVISWSLPQRAEVTFTVFDILGRQVDQRDLGELPAGEHSLEWSQPVASGVYLYRLRAGEWVAARKMTLLK